MSTPSKLPGLLRQALASRVVVADGAMGTMLQAANPTLEDFQNHEGCNEILNVSRPDIVRSVHNEYLSAGVDAIETNTFGANWSNLADYGIEDRIYELAYAGGKIAREAADAFSTSEKPRFVLGSLGPGTKLPSLGHTTYENLKIAYYTAAKGLSESGCDALLVETSQDLLQVKAAINGCRQAIGETERDIVLIAQVTVETTGTMLLGSEIGAALNTLEPMGIDLIGLNCATGPTEMSEHLRYLSKNAKVAISVMPNAGLPVLGANGASYPLGPNELAVALKGFVDEYGIALVGGCCGTTPEHLSAVVNKVSGKPISIRTPDLDPGASSLYQYVPFRQDKTYLAIGERTNANGSRAFRDALLAEDWEKCVEIARDQIRDGAHMLDLSVDYVGRDGTTDMAEIAGRFASQASVPLVIDSTEPQVMEAALQLAGGRCILNSANLEDGEDPGRRMDRIFSLARDYGAAVICLLIDERGQARDVEWKMQIAHRLHKIATERYGLSASDLIFDPLTFPLTTGDADLRRDGIESIEGIRRIKQEIPGALTVMGLSNVSFGINPAARQVLNSVFLDECVKAGLDAAIVHASKILPLARIKPEHVTLCRDIIFDKTTDDYNPLQLLLTAFEGVKSTKQEKPDRSGWPVRQRLRQRIIDGDREGLTAELDEALGEGLKALEIVNDVLLDGMREVGELFGSGQMQLPFVLQSAETMKMAVGHLEPHMDKVAGSTSKGKLVLATVKGDVHDIGKNLVYIICTNNGYEVHNIGIKIPISEMITKVQEVDADALGMSGLLVKSTLIMRENLEELNTSGLSNIPVLLGGAALTRSYVERDLREVYQGRVFYGRDAFEGLHTLDKLMEMKRNGIDDPEFGRIPTGRSLAERRAPKESPIDLPRRSPDVVDDNPVFTPPFVGSRVVKGISLDEIAEYVNETALYRNQWQYRPLEGENDEDFKSRIRPELRQQLAQAKASGILVPQLVYGYFPANGDGNDVVIWTDESRTTERMRFSYPRQGEAPFLCIADFFRPVESGEVDYAAFHIVTMGAKVSDAAAELFAKNEYQKYLTVHGLGVEMAEALAEYWHHRIRTEWGFVGEDGPNLHGLFRQQYRGGRYSWGYPACPDLEDNAKVAELLEAGRIGITVNEDTGWQYQPEQTTSAIICHHPRAKYFVAR